MVTEACLFGLPVFIAHWQEEKGRIANFHKIMNSSGYTQYLQKANENLKPKILNQMPNIAMQISMILRKHLIKEILPFFPKEIFQNQINAIPNNHF